MNLLHPSESDSVNPFRAFRGQVTTTDPYFECSDPERCFDHVPCLRLKLERLKEMNEEQDIELQAMASHYRDIVNVAVSSAEAAYNHLAVNIFAHPGDRSSRI